MKLPLSHAMVCDATPPRDPLRSLQGRVSKPRLFGGNGAASVGMTRSIGARQSTRKTLY